MHPNFFQQPDKSITQDERRYGENIVSILDNRNEQLFMNFYNERDPHHNQIYANGNKNVAPEMNQAAPTFYDSLRAEAFNQGFTPVRPISKEYWNQAPLDTKFTTLTSAVKKELPDNFAKLSEDAANRQNIKNTYINKINSLISNENPPAFTETNEPEKSFEEIKNAFHIKNESDFNQINNAFKMGKKARSYDVLRPDEVEKINQKLARNRESARNSRKRKKIYIDLLEKKVDQLSQELADTRKQLDDKGRGSSTNPNPSKQLQEFITGKQQLYERLQKMIEANADDSEVGFLIDSLRFRLGSSANDRVQTLSGLFKQILEQMVPPQTKSLMQSVMEGKDKFSKNGKGQPKSPGKEIMSWNEIIDQIGPNEAQKKTVYQYKDKLMSEKLKLDGAVQQLKSAKKFILKQVSSLQNIIDDFREMLTPTQVGKFLIIIDKNPLQETEQQVAVEEKPWQSAHHNNDFDDSNSNGSDSDDFLDNMEREDNNTQGQNPQYNQNFLDFEFLKDMPTDPLRKKQKQDPKYTNQMPPFEKIN